MLRAATEADSLIQQESERALREGAALFFREWTNSDGVFLSRQHRAVSASATSCALCHNMPRGTPGAGGTVFDPPTVGRNVPHLFGIGAIEAMGAAVSSALNNRYDRDQDGILSLSELPNGLIRIRVAESSTMNLGSLAQGEATLNPALALHYFGHGGQRVYPAHQGSRRALEAPEVAGVRFVFMPFGASISDHQFASLEEFTRGVFQAVFGMRVQTELASAEGHCPALGVTSGEVKLLVNYLRQHPAPRPTGKTALAIQGVRLLREFRCTTCHFESWSSASRFLPRLQPVPGVFTDLLHHDVGEKFHETFELGGVIYTLRKFRTPPLWGVGSTAPYGHDGRSPTLEHVILRHGGEAQESKERFARASSKSRKALIAFLSSLHLKPATTPSTQYEARSAEDGRGTAEQESWHIAAAAVDVCRVSATDIAALTAPLTLQVAIRGEPQRIAEQLEHISARLEGSGGHGLRLRSWTEMSTDREHVVIRTRIPDGAFETDREAARRMLLDLRRTEIPVR